MASTALSYNFTGTCKAGLEYQERKCSNLCLSILPGLCTNLTLGVDYQSQYKSVTFQYRATLPPLSVCGFSTLYMELLTSWESFHWSNYRFQEQNILFSAHMQPCLFYTNNTAHAEYRWPRIPLTLVIIMTTELPPINILPFKENHLHVNVSYKKKERYKHKQTWTDMSDNSQHRLPYCTLVPRYKGPVSLVVWLAGHNRMFALVEVNSHLETLNWI